MSEALGSLFGLGFKSAIINKSNSPLRADRSSCRPPSFELRSSMKNRKRRRTRNTPSLIPGKDRLSDLPDDVVLNILERLDMSDAMRTCILSKNMKATLPDMLSRIALDVAAFSPPNHRLTLRDVVRMNGAVADLTTTVLEFRRPEIPIHHFTLRFYLRYYDCISIAGTLARAMATQKLDGAAAVEFSILTEKRCHDCTEDDLVYFASQFHTFFTAYPAVFAGLTRLQLENLWFGESDIPSILLTCKYLQFLRLFNCRSVRRSVLQVEHHHLVELEISYGNFETVELVLVPKLQRMTCQGWISYQEPLFFGYTPLLSSLSLVDTGVSWKNSIRLSHFLANAPSLHQLNLSFQSEMIWVEPEGWKRLSPVLRELRHVALVDLPEGCDIAWTMFIVEAAPRLENLSIRVWDHWCKMERDKAARQENGYCDKSNVDWHPSVANLKHHNLSKLTIVGFQPDENFVRYIRRVIESAVNLEEISLYDRVVRKCCSCLDPKTKSKVVQSRYPRTMKEQMLLKKEMTKGLLSEMDLSHVIHFRS